MSEFISLQEGKSMTATYRTERNSLITDEAVPASLLPLCETFDKGQVTALLSKTNCERLRIYLGFKDGEIRLILVGVNSNDEDILPESNQSNLTDPEDDFLLERGVRCPSDCPPESELNS